MNRPSKLFKDSTRYDILSMRIALSKRESNGFKKGREKGSNVGVLPLFFDA
jgi:hypothetical protein